MTSLNRFRVQSSLAYACITDSSNRLKGYGNKSPQTNLRVHRTHRYVSEWVGGYVSQCDAVSLQVILFQSVIVQKLTAAQRAALRTLQGYSRHGQALIPPQLTFLIQQLGLLSNQLGGGANNELSTDLHQIMVRSHHGLLQDTAGYVGHSRMSYV